VTVSDGAENVTGDGPLTWDQAIVSAPPAGRPSSVTTPFSVAIVCGNTRA
jgi:hypothetical protein